MATNFIQDGCVIDFVNATGSTILSGAVVVIGTIIGIAIGDILDTETGAVRIDGVFELPKVSAAVLSVGESVQYDLSALEIADDGATPASGDLVGCGVVVEAAGNGVLTAKVKINVVGAAVTA
jgi:predicted RecA/RadA family phage recombinase